MFKLIGKMLGSEKALGASIDAVRSGLDALVYTDEEKATDAAKERSEARSMVVGWMQATQGQNLARRFIALTVTLIWAAQYVIAIVLDAAIPFTAEPTQVVLSQTADAIRSGGEQVTGAFMLVIGFYFAAPHLSSIVGGAMDKFKNGNK
jgi:hypothetical protein